VRKLVFDPQPTAGQMSIVCFISGSGTNYREIVARNPKQHYLVFTNRPGCAGLAIAREYKHEIIELSHVPFLKEARKKYGPGNIPRNCPERRDFEQEAVKLIENQLGGQPDLVCLAGFDQWNTDWFVEHYFPRILNVHPGDTTRGYAGLHWVPTAKAILAGEQSLRSTLFFVDQSMDQGPVLTQSAPLKIVATLRRLDTGSSPGLFNKFQGILAFAAANKISDYNGFQEKASPELRNALEAVCSALQDAIKVDGDWKIYPFAVHDLIARGRVAIDGSSVYVDGKLMPVYGYRPDEN
jgi:phosphoribosylglycinamide formyltransferase 1